MAGGGGTGPIGGVPRPSQFGWYRRRLPVLTPLPMPGNAGVTPLLPPTVLVVQQRQPPSPNRGAFFRAALIAAKINVAGGVIRPWVVRRDSERGGLFFREQPFLKTPPPPVPGGVPASWVRRWDFERAGLFYRERPHYAIPLTLAPPPVLFDGSTWFAEGRGNVWDILLRSLSWRAAVATFLTKRSGEIRQYGMDFSALPELQSASLAGVSSVVAVPLTVAANNVTLTNPALGSNGKTATVWISGGDVGASYKITFTVTLAGGIVLEDFGYLLVEDE